MPDQNHFFGQAFLRLLEDVIFLKKTGFKLLTCFLCFQD